MAVDLSGLLIDGYYGWLDRVAAGQRVADLKEMRR